MSDSTVPDRDITVGDRSIPDDPLVLAAEHLTKRYNKREVVKDVSLRVQQGEIVGLLGPNGAGKTTTFHMIVGMVRPNDGRILFGGDDITRLPMYKRARRGVGYLAQETSVFRELSVEENLHAVLEFQSMSTSDRKARVESLIREFGLGRVRESKGYALSGGERLQPARQAYAVEARLNLNLAALAHKLKESQTADEHFENALSAAEDGVLPDLKWRALAGLGRLKEALFVLQNYISPARAGLI